jgi:hypothetical protein
VTFACPGYACRPNGQLTAGDFHPLDSRPCRLLLPNRLEHLNTPSVQMGFLPPVILWAYLRFLQGARWRHLLVLVLALWGQALSSLYYGFAAGALLLAVGLGHALLRPETITWRLVGRGALGTVALALALAPFLTPYWVVHRSLGFERPETLANWFGMDLLSGLDPGAFSTLYRHNSFWLRHSEGGLFPGVVVLLLVGAAVILAIRPGDATTRGRRDVWARASLLLAAGPCVFAIFVAARRTPSVSRIAGIKIRIRDATLPVHALPLLAYGWTALARRRPTPGAMSARDWLLVLGPATILMYLFTLTPDLTIHDRSRGTALFHWVYAYVPGAAAFRAPGRWALVYALPLALVAATALAALTGRLSGRARGVVSAAVVALVMVECLPLPIPWQTRVPMPPSHRWLAQQPGDFAVALLPVAEGRQAAWAMLWATTHRKRLVNGAFVFVPEMLQTLTDEEDSVDLGAFVATLRSIYPLRYAIVNRALLPPAELAAWARVDRDPGRGVAFVDRFGDDDVFSVAGTPQRGVTLRRWFSADLVPPAEYAIALAGVDLAARRRIEVWFGGHLLATHEGPPGRL